jgi:predicted secreted protein
VVVRKQVNRGDAAINITRADFHGEWNYTIQPSNVQRQRLIPDNP